MAAPAPATILFVDDNAANRHAFGMILRAAGFHVLEAETGTEALRLVREKPDLVILDVNLPDLTGFEVCSRIKADPATASTSVLMMSAVFVSSGDRTHGLEEGADGYLCKPFEPRELLATVRSLLRLRQAEEAARQAAQQWRTTFDAISDAVCLVSAAGTVSRCNRAMADLLGRPYPALVGQPFPRIIQEALALDQPPPLNPFPESAVREPRELALGERWFRVTDDPIVDEAGHFSGSVHILREVTERRKLEDQLRQVQKQEAIGRLAGGVAHDFNNLLTAILGNASLLLARLTKDDPEFEYASTIERAAWRAAELTRQLLGFSRQTLLWLKPTNLNDSLDEVTRLLERTIDPRITLEVRPAPEPWLVQADPGQISQVLMNLCLNARDAMPRGGQLVLEATNSAVEVEHVRRHPEARPGEYVRLRVADTGEGIPSEILPRIFDPFFTTKEPGKGTGLGLAMVFGIVQQHQGWIECQSQPGQGTCFDVYLPRLQDAPAPTPRPVVPSTAAWGGDETILLADDNVMLRSLAVSFLQQYGYEVLLAEDGLQAVETFQRERERIDLVVLDLMMPRLSGREALRRIRQIDPDVRVLFVSGYSDAQLEGEQQEVLGFVGKPYRERDLVNAVRTALDKPLSKSQ